MRNAMVIVGVYFLFALLPSFTSFAQYQEQDYVARHLKEDREWARKSGLSAASIRKLRLLAGVPDESDTLIDSVDAKRLRSRNQLLLVTTSGNGHCLDLYVFEHRRRDHRLIWSANGMPSGAGFCRESSYNPEAYVRSGKIVVKIPVFDYQRGVRKSTDFYTYAWSGKSYRYVSRRSVRVRKRNSAFGLRATRLANHCPAKCELRSNLTTACSGRAAQRPAAEGRR